MAKEQVFILSSEVYEEVLRGNKRAIEYSCDKQPAVGDTVVLKCYSELRDYGFNSRMDGRIVAIDELPRKRGYLRRWLFTINVQLIMF